MAASRTTTCGRAGALGVYRFWRDAGYAVGALIGGVTVALASFNAAIAVAAILTAISGLLAWVFMRETHPRPGQPGPPRRRHRRAGTVHRREIR